MLWVPLFISPLPDTMPHNQEETPSSQILPGKGRKGLDHNQGSISRDYLRNLFLPCLNLSSDRKGLKVESCWEERKQCTIACTQSYNSALSKWMNKTQISTLLGEGKSWSQHSNLPRCYPRHWLLSCLSRSLPGPRIL